MYIARIADLSISMSHSLNRVLCIRRSSAGREGVKFTLIGGGPVETHIMTSSMGWRDWRGESCRCSSTGILRSGVQVWTQSYHWRHKATLALPSRVTVPLDLLIVRVISSKPALFWLLSCVSFGRGTNVYVCSLASPLSPFVCLYPPALSGRVGKESYICIGGLFVPRHVTRER